jgi:hypothetical protein
MFPQFLGELSAFGDVLVARESSTTAAAPKSSPLGRAGRCRDRIFAAEKAGELNDHPMDLQGTSFRNEAHAWILVWLG